MLWLLSMEKVIKKYVRRIQKSCDTRNTGDSCLIYHIRHADLTNTIMILMMISVIVIMMIIIMIITMAILIINIRVNSLVSYYT